jgi:hypothetical protein
VEGMIVRFLSIMYRPTGGGGELLKIKRGSKKEKCWSSKGPCASEPSWKGPCASEPLSVMLFLHVLPVPRHSAWTFGPLNLRPVLCLEMSVTKRPVTQSHAPEMTSNEDCTSRFNRAHPDELFLLGFAH